jgi:predicted HicB family RNase H-like nuclease
MTQLPAQETHRSFTVRVPMSLYLSLAEMAQADGVFINQKANQLLRLGMGKHVSLDQAVLRLIKDKMEDQAQ